jgi:cell division transport system permease protein
VIPIRLENILDLVVRGAVCNWARSRRTVMPALGSMTALLLLMGLVGMAALAARSVLDQEAAGAAVLRVYLRDGASRAEVAALRHRLRSDRRVRVVRYVSRQEALHEVRDRPGLGALVGQVGANTLPASLEVGVRGPGNVEGVAEEVRGDPAVESDNPPSFDTDTFRALQSFLFVAALVASAILLGVALVAGTVTANAVRAAVMARWDEVTTMWLVGASGWMVRGPFLVEGTLTGAVAGAMAAGLLLGVYGAAQGAGRAMFTHVLPGVEWGTALACGAAVVLSGPGLGSLAALFGLRALRGLGR